MTPFSFQNYARKTTEILNSFEWAQLDPLAHALRHRWQTGHRVFMCGNGGSAGNATHLANDLIYGAMPEGKAIRATSLTDNASILTCIGNDVSYDSIFALQLETLAEADDLLIVFSGSGNSPNVIEALKKAKELGLETAAILGFTGGKCKELADTVIHFEIDDMQIAEDLQLNVGHMLIRWLRENPPVSD